MTGPVRLEISAAGHAGPVFASREMAGGSAPAVVLIHGIGASHRYLRRLHRLLAGGVAAIDRDLAGLGAPPPPPEPQDLCERRRVVVKKVPELLACLLGVDAGSFDECRLLPSLTGVLRRNSRR